MIGVYLIGLVAGLFTAVAQRISDPLGFFREPDPDVPTLWRQIVRTTGWVAVAFAFLLWWYLLLSALTADNIVGRDGIMGRILQSIDGVVLGVLRFARALVPDVEVSL